MRPLFKKAVIGAGAYVTLWAFSYLVCPRSLSLHLDARKEHSLAWEREQAKLPRSEHAHHAEEDRLVNFVDLENITCPAPFVLSAKGKISVGRLAELSYSGRFIWTPWKLYHLSEDTVENWIR